MRIAAIDTRITNEGRSRDWPQGDPVPAASWEPDDDGTLLVQGAHCNHYYRVPKAQVLNHLFDVCPHGC